MTKTIGIQAHELLPVGTKVSVGDRIGTVTKAEMVQAHPCGLVCSHTIRFDKRIEFVRLNSGMKRLTEVDITPVESKPNYGFIRRIEG
jgi:hypothetical protein